VARTANEQDARIKEVVITEKGRVMTGALDGARQKIITSILADWDKEEVTELARLLRKLANAALQFVRTEKSRSA